MIIPLYPREITIYRFSRPLFSNEKVVREKAETITIYMKSNEVLTDDQVEQIKKERNCV